jgi:hypothetical protein
MHARQRLLHTSAVCLARCACERSAGGARHAERGGAPRGTTSHFTQSPQSTRSRRAEHGTAGTGCEIRPLRPARRAGARRTREIPDTSNTGFVRCSCRGSRGSSGRAKRGHSGRGRSRRAPGVSGDTICTYSTHAQMTRRSSCRLCDLRDLCVSTSVITRLRTHSRTAEAITTGRSGHLCADCMRPFEHGCTSR